MLRTLRVTARPLGTGEPLRVVLVGLGPIGRNVAEECLRRGAQRVVIAGAIDRDPKLIGKTLGELWGGAWADSKVRVVAAADQITERADVALLTTTSRLESLEPQLEPLFARGLNVVSSSEELFYPALSDPARAARIDALAKMHGVSVNGAGINPGFLMDVLPTVLAVASGPPHRVRCERYVDLAQRRVPLQMKAGMGMDADEFRRRAEAIQIGHVGLIESIAYLAGRLGFAATSIEESLEPVLAADPFEWQGETHPAGRVIGFVHQGRAWCEFQTRDDAPIQFYLRMSYHQTDPHDRIVLDGAPPIDMTIRPCTAGDPATAAVLVHLAARVVEAEPGLRPAHELGLVPQGPDYQIERV